MAIREERAKRVYNEEELLAFGKSCFYKGFEKAEKDDANCYTAFREEIESLIEQFKTKKNIEKIIASMNLMLSKTKVIELTPLPESKKNHARWTFGYNTNDYTLYFSNGDIYVDTNFGLFVADKINL